MDIPSPTPVCFFFLEYLILGKTSCLELQTSQFFCHLDLGIGTLFILPALALSLYWG